MSYTSVFGGTTIYPSDVSYLPLALAVDTTLEWPLEASGDVTVAARIIGVTPASAGRSVIMPDATRTGPGQSVLFNNMSGTYSFLVKDDGGTTLATVAPGTQWQIYLTDNTTAAGTWEVYQMGASTATVQASALAGPGLMVVGSQLAQAAPFTNFTGNLSPSISNRAAMYVYTGSGAATLSLPVASTVGNEYFLRVRNQGGGVLLIDPAGTDLVNGGTSLNLAPEDSAMIVCDGASKWYTVGLGQNAEFTFDFTSIPLSGGTYTLSGAQLNRIAYRFTGNLNSNAVIVVPDTVQQYWVDNQTDGAFTLGLKTSTQALPTLVNQKASAIMYSDGATVVLADTSTLSLPIAVVQGGTGATTPSGARDNLGISAYADPLVTATNSSAAQAVLFPDAITDGQMLIGNAAAPGFAQTTLTAGNGIGVVNGPGSVTIVNTGSPAPGTVYSQNFSGTGAQTAFTLAYQPFNEDNTQVYISGVYQQKNTYSLSGSTITFASPPPLGTNNIEVVVIQVVALGVTNANMVNYTPALTGAVASTVQAKLSEIVTPYDFGAVGNGIADDTTPVQLALNSPATQVYLAAGRFRLTGTVTSAVDDRTINGPGSLTATTAIGTALTVTGDRNEVAVNIDGNDFIGVGIRFDGAELPIVSGGRIRDLKSTTANCAGLFFSDTQAGFIARGVTITNVDSVGDGTLGNGNGFSRGIAVGLSGDPTGNSVIEGCYISNIIGEEGDAIGAVSGGGGAYFRLDLTVKGNNIRGFNRRAVKTQGNNVRVIGNSISNDWTSDTQVPNRASVIDFVQGSDCIARDNDLYNCNFFNQVSVFALAGEAWSNILVSGNTFWGLSDSSTDTLVSLTPTGSASVAFTNGSANITSTDTLPAIGAAVQFLTSGALPTNFSTGATYFVRSSVTVSGTTTITVSATPGGIAVVAGSAGSGTHTLIGAKAAAVTFTNASANIATNDSVPAINTGVQLLTTGTLPTNFSTGTTYYVLSSVKVGATTTFSLSATPGGTAIVAGSAGSGTHTLVGVETAAGIVVTGNIFSGGKGRAVSVGRSTGSVVSNNIVSVGNESSTRTISFTSSAVNALVTGNMMLGGVRQSFIANDATNSVVSDNHVKTNTPLFSNSSGFGNHLAANNSIDGTAAFYFNINTTVGNRLGDNYNFASQINTAPGTLFTASASGPTVALSGLQVRVGQVVIDSTPTAGGKIGWTATTSGVSAVAWAPTTAYLVGAYVSNGGNGYVCTTAGTSAGAGGPTGTSLTVPVADGTAAWLYVSPAVTWKQFGAIDV